MKVVCTGLLIGLGLSMTVTATAHEKEHASTAAASPAFEKIKQLAGDWTMAGGDGSIAVTYRLTGGGSAVVETLFPGSPHEMMTVYHMDGKDIMLTHYCGAQNQPRMKAMTKDDSRLAFMFTGGTNLDPSKDGHMHEAVMQFVDSDKIHNEWVYFSEGKKQETKAFDLTRIKR